jgi:hypothetical protein
MAVLFRVSDIYESAIGHSGNSHPRRMSAAPGPLRYGFSGKDSCISGKD